MAIDVGNTQFVVGLFEAGEGDRVGELLYHWRVSTHPAYTADELAVQLAQLLALDGLSLKTVSGVVVASVVPPVQEALRQLTGRRLGVPLVVVGPGTRTGVNIVVDNPREVGADRIADVVAAFERYGGPTIVVDFGTATNFEVVSGQQEYIGGLLFPGVEVSLNALTTRAALLPKVEIASPKGILGKNTVEQLQSGVFYGFGALVDGVCAKLKAQIGPATVVATGGLAPLLLQAATCIDHHEPWLTLLGLASIYKMNLADA